MAIYQDEQNGQIFTDFGNGRTLTIYLKEAAQGAGAVDEILERFEQSQMIQKRIEGIKAQIANSATPHSSLQELQSQLKELKPQAKNIGEMVSLIYAIGESWDNYASEADEKAGLEPLPFTEATIRRIHPTRLARIVENIAVYIRMDDDEGKAQGTLSPAPLPREAVPPSTIPVGIYDNKTGARSLNISSVPTSKPEA